MFGSKYFRYPKILLDSFSEMKEGKKKEKINKSVYFLLKIYIFIFGIPEIGFQERAIVFHRIIRDRLQDKNLHKILDAGSGIGIFTFEIADKYPQSLVWGRDLDKKKILLSKKLMKEFKISNIKFEITDISKMNTKEKFDLIVNIDVLEHIKNYKKVLKSFYDMLSLGGYLYIHTPQLNQKRIFPALKNWSHEGHEREGFDPNILQKDFKKLGFKIVDIRETFGFFGKLAWELNHIALGKSFILAGIIYPIIFPLIFIDTLFKVNHGLGIAVLVKK